MWSKVTLISSHFSNSWVKALAHGHTQTHSLCGLINMHFVNVQLVFSVFVCAAACLVWNMVPILSVFDANLFHSLKTFNTRFLSSYLKQTQTYPLSSNPPLKFFWRTCKHARAHMQTNSFLWIFFNSKKHLLLCLSYD